MRPEARRHANGFWQAYYGGQLITGHLHRLRRDALAFAHYHAKTGRFDAGKFKGFKP